MKIVAFSDLHAHNHEQHAKTLPTGQNSRFADIIGVVDEITVYCTKNLDVCAVVFCGDVFHSRTKVDTDVYSATWLAFQRLSKAITGPLIILVGNHDQNTKVGDVHALEAFRAFAQVVDRQSRYNLQDMTSILAWPFTADTEALQKQMADASPANLVLFHQGLSEGAVGAFDVYVKAELSIKDLPRAKANLILGGHYHKHQEVVPRESNNAAVYYVGSPLQLDYGERTEKKGFLVIDTVTWEVTQVPTRAPEFIWVHEAELSSLNIAPTDFVRITCAPADADRLKRAYPAAQLDVVIPKKEAAVRVTQEVAGDDSSLLGAYIAASKTPLNVEQLLSTGLDLLKDDNAS